MFHRVKILAGVVLILMLAPVGMAQAQYSSANYMVNQTFFGSGGELGDVSASYQARVTAGELGIGHAGGSGNTPAFVQGAQNYASGSGTSLSAAYGSSVTSGDLLVVAVGGSANTIYPVSDSQGNTYTKAVSNYDSGIPYYSAVYYTVAGSSAADTVTVNPTSAASSRRIAIQEYSGVNTLDATSSNTGSGTTVDSGSAPTNVANELVFGWMVSGTGVTSPGSGFLVRETSGSDSTMDKNVTSTGSYNVTAPTTSSSWVGLMATFYGSSANYQAYSGFNTTDRPVLEVAVSGGTFDLGTLSTTQVSAISTDFTVRSYLSSGYTVQLGGTAPKNDGSSYTLSNLTTPTASSPGTEQFGVNLAANDLTGPGAFGAVPAQIPDTSFGFGVANSNYATTNLFKFVENDTIAHSNSSSGVTQYTLSAIANISSTTPGGSYGTSLFVNAVPTF